jgi:hypothetical protein
MEDVLTARTAGARRVYVQNVRRLIVYRLTAGVRVAGARARA